MKLLNVYLVLFLMASVRLTTGLSPVFAAFGKAAVRLAVQQYGQALVEHAVDQGIAAIQKTIENKPEVNLESAIEKPESTDAKDANMAAVVVDQTQSNQVFIFHED